MLRYLRAVVPILVASALGCQGDFGDAPEHGTVSIAAATENGLSINGLRLRGRSLHKIGSGGLGQKESTNGLDPNILDQLEPGSTAVVFASDSELSTTEEGRSLLKYVATCALPADQELVVEHEGNAWLYPGLLNLAPQWVEGSCDTSCQRWMSACLLAHVNATGSHVPISLRANHPELAPNDEEKEKFDFVEGAFFGQLFIEEPELYSCIGQNWAGRLFAEDDSDTRECTRSLCGIDLIGYCEFAAADQAMCNEHGPYGDCITKRGRLDSPRYQEVITVHLQHLGN